LNTLSYNLALLQLFGFLFLYNIISNSEKPIFLSKKQKPPLANASGGFLNLEYD